MDRGQDYLRSCWSFVTIITQAIHLYTYKTAKRDLVRTIREAKRNCWKDLCLELDDNIWGDAYRIVTKRFNSLTPYNLSMDRKKQILKDLFPITPDELGMQVTKADVTPFTLEELDNAITTVKPGRAPGPDKVPPEAIKEVGCCALLPWL
ncbi:hypothetical protein QE152_g21974 [Popillia japonica]|uniref:Reverse transcriptase n=1 Tax=Popillia japonica TaxID=7064 RepID=A0AAW1KM74_POPJA